MKLKKYFAALAVCAAAMLPASISVSAEQVTTPAPTTAPTAALTVAPANTTVPSFSLNVNPYATTTMTGAVLGGSTPENSASTGDTGVVAAFIGLAATAGVGALAVAVRSRKK